MKLKVLMIVAVLAVFTQETVFAQAKKADVDYDAIEKQVYAYLEEGNLAAAIPLLKRLHELKPDNLDVIEAIGLFYMGLPGERPALTNALYWLTESEKHGSSNNNIYYDLACVYSIKQDIKKAESAMNKAITLGFFDIEYMNKDDDLVNFRKGTWWKDIANNDTLIKQQLYLFNDIASGKSGKNITERITSYIGIITELKKLAPNIPAMQCLPLFFLASSYKEIGNYADAEIILN